MSVKEEITAPAPSNKIEDLKLILEDVWLTN